MLTTPIEQVSFVAIDVETTGLDPIRDKIVEIGAVRVTGGRMVEEFETLVGIKRSMPPYAERVHRITNEMLLGKPPIEEALGMLTAFLGDCMPVEHCHESFDMAFLAYAHGKPLAPVIINTYALSRSLFPFLPSHSLQTCCKMHRITNRTPHRALSDARATAQLLICLTGICAKRYPRLGDLMKVAAAGAATPIEGRNRARARQAGRRQGRL
ncbi:MAG: 3'-5' exonuclease [Chloroflexota bacterium]